MRFTLTALSLLFLAGVASAQESYSAKSLFFGEDESVVAVSTSKKDAPTALAADQDGVKKGTPKVAASKKATPAGNIGASYFIRLKNADGSTRNVLASRKFKSGERFQLGVKVNRPSYVYIFNEDPNGKVSQIYPRPGRDNFIDAMGVVFLPSQGAFEFDQEAGVEQLLVYVSPTPVATGMPERIGTMRPDVVTATPETAPVVAAASCEQPAVASAPAPAAPGVLIASAGDYAAKGIALSDDAGCAKDAAKGESYAAKGIAFTDDSDAGGTQAASYVVKKTTSTDASLFLKVKLDHK